MKFIADENIDKIIVDYLRKKSERVLYIAEFQKSVSDDEIITIANREKAILLTSDKDFGELIFRQKRVNQGVILIRLAGLSPIRKAKIVSEAIKKYYSQMVNNFTVITPGSIRIRKMPLPK